MTAPINAAAVASAGRGAAGLAVQGFTCGVVGSHARRCVRRVTPPAAGGAVGPVCVLLADALAANLATMAQWCDERGVELAPHGKTHMSPQLLARQFDAGACAVTAATISQVRIFRAFGVRNVVLANELVDAGRTALAGRRTRRASGLHPGVLGRFGARSRADGVDVDRSGRGPARGRLRRGRHGGRPHGLPRGATPSTRWPARSSPPRGCD